MKAVSVCLVMASPSIAACKVPANIIGQRKARDEYSAIATHRQRFGAKTTAQMNRTGHHARGELIMTVA
jgi:hypothetical protein